MKKGLIALVMAFALVSNVQAATSEVADGMGKKFVRGVVNLVTGVVEIPAQIIKGYQHGIEAIEDDVGSKTVGTVLGIFRGFGHAAGRTSWGALEVFGFWSVNPADNMGVGIPLDAEYAWEEGNRYSIFSPSFEEGIKPIGRKLVRGLGDGFLGIAELPGQTIKGIKDGHVFLGVGKGVWYWFSREVYGLGSIFSCIVPNPEDNPGVAFEEKWAWDALSNNSN